MPEHGREGRDEGPPLGDVDPMGHTAGLTGRGTRTDWHLLLAFRRQIWKQRLLLRGYARNTTSDFSGFKTTALKKELEFLSL